MLNRGFIVLTTVIIICTSLLALLYVSSLSSAYLSDSVKLKKIRIENYFNAGNCIDVAISNVSKDYFYNTQKKN